MVPGSRFITTDNKRNGTKGNALFLFFIFCNIAKTSAKRKAKSRTYNIFSKSRNMPLKKINFISAAPISCFLYIFSNIKTIINRGMAMKTALRRLHMTLEIKSVSMSKKSKRQAIPERIIKLLTFLVFMSDMAAIRRIINREIISK